MCNHLENQGTLNQRKSISQLPDCHWSLLGSAGSIVLLSILWRTHKSPTRITCCSWIVSIEVLAASNVMPNHKHYPKEVIKKLTECGHNKFRCLEDLCYITRKDHKPIHFLRNYVNQRKAAMGNRCVRTNVA